MSNFRLPQNLSTQLSIETGESRLQQEINAEQAAALGRAGSRVENTIQRLRDFDGAKFREATRHELVGDAADAVWGFLVQREVMGMRDQDQVIKHYGIPGDVLSRVGERLTKK